MNIIFLHGRLSNPESSKTAKAVSEYFSSDPVWVPDYRPTERNYMEIQKYLKEYVSKVTSPLEETIFIGISLGGYWALNMCDKTPNSSCILLNPSMWYYGNPLWPKSSRPITIILNDDDELLDSNKTVEYYKNRALIKRFPVGGHRMTNIAEVLPTISKAAYSTDAS